MPPHSLLSARHPATAPLVGATEEEEEEEGEGQDYWYSSLVW